MDALPPSNLEGTIQRVRVVPVHVLLYAKIANGSDNKISCCKLDVRTVFPDLGCCFAVPTPVENVFAWLHVCGHFDHIPDCMMMVATHETWIRNWKRGSWAIITTAEIAAWCARTGFARAIHIVVLP